MTARLARLLAVGIAIAAAIDPGWTVTIRGRGTIGVIEPEGSRIADRLSSDYRVARGDLGAPVLVVVGRAYPTENIPATARVATVTLPAAEPDVRLATIDAPRAVPGATTIHLDATVASGPTRPVQTTIAASIDGVMVGRAQQKWSGSDDRWHAALDVVPIGEPPWVMAIAVDDRDARDVLVDRVPRIPVTFYEPRPSWATTFARRALERDPRFVVDAVTRLGDLNAVAVVVGGLDRITDADVATLDRFVHDRGGAVVMLPDERLSAASPAARLLPAREDERELLLDRPAPLVVSAPLPRLAASEVITFAGVDADADVLARTADAARPVVWTARRGEGRVLVSGALDAWRFRAEDHAAFDRFWRAVISGVALATPPLVEVSASPAVARPLDTVRVHVRVHRSIAANGLSVSASLTSGEVVRLWPDAGAGSFSGSFTASARDRGSRVEVAATSGTMRTTGSAPYVVSGFSRTAEGMCGTSAVRLKADTTDAVRLKADTTDAVRLKADTTCAPLGLLSASHGGIDVTPADLSPLDRWLRATVTAPAVRAVRHPMRSPWWIVPFVACLSIDWWITSSRRRRR